MTTRRHTPAQHDTGTPERDDSHHVSPAVPRSNSDQAAHATRVRAHRAGGANGASINLQRLATNTTTANGADVHEHAARGVGGAGGALPHADAIQKSFGKHDVSTVTAHIGGPAARAADAIGAEAYALGKDVAFRAPPDLHTAAHEAAHVVQQRAGVHLSGGVGAAGDIYEQHADRVADRVEAGQSSEALLDELGGAGSSASSAVQRDSKSDSRDGAPLDELVKHFDAAMSAAQNAVNLFDSSPHVGPGILVTGQMETAEHLAAADTLLAMGTIDTASGTPAAAAMRSAFIAASTLYERTAKAAGNAAAGELYEQLARMTDRDSGLLTARVEEEHKALDTMERPSASTLEDLLKAINLQWKVDVHAGLFEFQGAALEKRINAIDSGDWSSFVSAMTGGIIGASGAFATPGAGFAIGVAGALAGTSVPKPASKNESVSQIMDMLLDRVDATHQALNTAAASMAATLLNDPELTDAGKYRLLWKYLEDNFEPGVYAWMSSGPELISQTIREVARAGATDLLERWQQEVQPIGAEISSDDAVRPAYRATGRLGFILIPGWEDQGRPALLHETVATTFLGTRRTYRFIRWISDDLAEAASMQYYGTGDDRLTLTPKDVEDAPA